MDTIPSGDIVKMRFLSQKNDYPKGSHSFARAQKDGRFRGQPSQPHGTGVKGFLFVSIIVANVQLLFNSLR
ncbi:hypothetical protein GCM10019814_21400 [Lactococcus raffinolactis]